MKISGYQGKGVIEIGPDLGFLRGFPVMAPLPGGRK